MFQQGTRESLTLIFKNYFFFYSVQKKAINMNIILLQRRTTYPFVLSMQECTFFSSINCLFRKGFRKYLDGTLLDFYFLNLVYEQAKYECSGCGKREQLLWMPLVPLDFLPVQLNAGQGTHLYVFKFFVASYPL